MATAALGKRAEVSDMELRRSGVSYTADTLAALRQEIQRNIQQAEAYFEA